MHKRAESPYRYGNGSYKFGAKWTGVDISKKQTEQAKRLSEGMDIDYYAMPAEDIAFFG